MTTSYHHADRTMRNSLRPAIAILARLLLAAIFLVSPLVNLIPNFGAVSDSLRALGVPAPSVALAIAIMLLLAGSMSIVAGYRTRYAALALILFLIPATLLYHAPWAATDPAHAGEQAVHFLKNIGLVGALLLLAINGPGPGSYDEAGK